MQQKVAVQKRWRFRAALCVSVVALLAIGNAAVGNSAGPAKNTDAADSVKTESPIKHVIILIGENRGLDHTFGVYKPKGKGQTISNMLSKGIVNVDGTPGPNFALAQQFAVSPQPNLLCRRARHRQDALQPQQPDAAAEHQRSAVGAKRHVSALQDRHGSQHRDRISSRATSRC